MIEYGAPLSLLDVAGLLLCFFGFIGGGCKLFAAPEDPANGVYNLLLFIGLIGVLTLIGPGTIIGIVF